MIGRNCPPSEVRHAPADQPVADDFAEMLVQLPTSGPHAPTIRPMWDEVPFTLGDVHHASRQMKFDEECDEVVAQEWYITALMVSCVQLYKHVPQLRDVSCAWSRALITMSRRGQSAPQISV